MSGGARKMRRERGRLADNAEIGDVAPVRCYGSGQYCQLNVVRWSPPLGVGFLDTP